MLARLLRRDWLLNRRALVLFAAVFAAIQVLLLRLPPDLAGIWLLLTCLYAAAMTVVPLAREGAFRTTIWSCSLPVRRADLVRARYFSAWMLSTGALLASFVLAGAVPGSRVSPAIALEMEVWLAAGAIITLVLALLLPFTIRFGMRGLAILLVVPLNILLPGVFVASKLTGSQDEVEATVLGGIQSVGAAIIALRGGLTRPVFYLSALTLLVLVNWASYRLAVALFHGREL